MLHEVSEHTTLLHCTYRVYWSFKFYSVLNYFSFRCAQVTRRNRTMLSQKAQFHRQVPFLNSNHMQIFRHNQLSCNQNELDFWSHEQFLPQILECGPRKFVENLKQAIIYKLYENPARFLTICPLLNCWNISGREKTKQKQNCFIRHLKKWKHRNLVNIIVLRSL